MSDTVKIILTGHVRNGFERGQVVATLADALKLGESEAADMLSGRETVIRQDVPLPIAGRHVKILRDIGLKVRVESTPGTAPAKTAGTDMAAMGDNPKSSHEAGEIPARKPRATLELVPIDNPGPGAAPDPARHVAHATPPSRQAGMARVAVAAPAFLGLSFEGRIGRLRYIGYSLLSLIPAAIAAIPLLLSAWGTLASGGRAPPGVTGTIFLMASILLVLFAAWVSIRCTVLRLHDINLSGMWYLLLGVAPGLIAGFSRSPGLMQTASVLSLILLIVLAILPGSKGDNDYGAQPG